VCRVRAAARGGDGLLLVARDLRRLGVTGSPTYRQLTRAHYLAAVLSEAASGRKLPSLAVTLAYVVARGGDVGAWEIRCRHTAALPTARPGASMMSVEAGQRHMWDW
jgi:hypothetical protein